MAARRLIAILIALLIVSTIAAALAPEQEEETTTEPTTTTETETDRSRPAGGKGVLRERVPADPPRPRSISADRGDQLILRVESEAPTAVTIPGLGRSAFATPLTPARFDILLRTPGTYPVRAGDRVVARLEVE
jgi:hypothetical protein